MISGRALVVGGAGAVGGMFADLLAGAGADVRIVDPAPDGAGYPLVAGDITAIDAGLRAELAVADTVVLAVPEPVALAGCAAVAGALRPGALLVDTLSVKGRIVPLARKHSDGLAVLSLNPMFAPALGITGRPVAAVVVRDDLPVRDLLRLLGQRGASVVEVDEAEHDRLAAATQALTHAAVLGFGAALTELDTDIGTIKAIAPPPHTVLLALLARIAGGTPEVYWDVQAANPLAPAARRALADGLRATADLVDRGDEAGFAENLAALRGFFGTELAHYRDLCASVFRDQC